MSSTSYNKSPATAMSSISTYKVLILLGFLHLCRCHLPSPLDSLRHDRARRNIDDKVLLKVSLTTLKGPGHDWVNVTWSGVQKPSIGDWIGVYSPPINGSTIDHSLHAPVKFQYANFTSSHFATGTGLLSFRLVNMRDEIIVGFFTGGFDEPTLAAVSDVITFTNPNEPLQGHLSYTGDPTKMILTWVSGQIGHPKVVWYASGVGMNYQKEATTSTYSAKDMCGAPAIDFGYRDPGMIHQATMDNLKPGYRYEYKFGDDDYGWSQVYSFKAPPMPSPNAAVKFIAFGDMGNGQEDDSRQVVHGQQPSLNTTRRVKGEISSTDVVLHIGDISYARGYASVWDEFFDQVQDIAAAAPYMVCIGNHERDFPKSGSFYVGSDSGGECGVPYEKRFPMPRPSLDEAWYGFDYGSVHVVLMSTEHDFRPQSAQYKFLDEHMSKVDRSVTPWLVFAGHRPMYVDSTNDSPGGGDLPVATQLQANIEPLLKKYKVDLALWGHHHSYQRTCPVAQGACDKENGITHVIIGMAGQELSQNLKSPAPSWIVVADDQHFGYSRFMANSTVLSFEYVRNDGAIPDSFQLKK